MAGREGRRMNSPARPRGFHLLDLSAIVVGYGMASLLIRAFWPSGEQPPLAEIVVIGLFYSWLGLAMSGPLVLLVPNISVPPGGVKGAEVLPRTWAELAWLIIGCYWIGLTILVVPVRLNR